MAEEYQYVNKDLTRQTCMINRHTFFQAAAIIREQGEEIDVVSGGALWCNVILTDTQRLLLNANGINTISL